MLWSKANSSSVHLLKQNCHIQSWGSSADTCILRQWHQKHRWKPNCQACKLFHCKPLQQKHLANVLTSQFLSPAFLPDIPAIRPSPDNRSWYKWGSMETMSLQVWRPGRRNCNVFDVKKSLSMTELAVFSNISPAGKQPSRFYAHTNNTEIS